MSMQALIDATAAQNALLDKVLAFMDNAQADVDAAVAEFDALKADVTAAVATQMDFVATWDPDEPAPTNVRGGTFSNLQALISAAPYGAVVTVRIPDGKAVTITERIYCHHQWLQFRPLGVAVAPGTKVIFSARVQDGMNHYNGLEFRYGGGFRATNLDIEITGKADAALDWATTTGPIIAGSGSGSPAIGVALSGVTMTATEAARFVRLYVAHTAMVNAWQCTLDGPLELVSGADTGVVMLATQSIALQNGAALHTEGALGVNILKN